ncbi:hypothetical protein M0R45_005765 [Rubus argutus]|uniref:Uncharacterized protein n=1 Tax=Rubus argutus TaxID=59490 RepID=A0AAW1YNK4_RUBAR
MASIAFGLRGFGYKPGMWIKRFSLGGNPPIMVSKQCLCFAFGHGLQIWYAVVTGSNKGIGLETVRQLASNGITVVLTARDEKRGLEAVEKRLTVFSNGNSSGLFFSSQKIRRRVIWLLKLEEFGHSDLVVFHQLDVRDPQAFLPLTNLSKVQNLIQETRYIGVSGTNIDAKAFKAASAVRQDDVEVNWNEIMTETYELSEECVKTNNYGAKNMTKTLLPLLQLSDSPRVVNVTSAMGTLKHIPNEWAKGVLSSDAENLTEERVNKY